MLAACVDCLLYGRLKVLVESLEHFVPILLAFCYGIKVLLHVCGEVVVHYRREVFHEEIVYDRTDVGRQQLTLLIAGHLLLGLCGNLVSAQGVNGVRAFFTLLVTFRNIFSLLYGRDGRSVCRRTTYAQFFHLVYERSLGISQWSL